MKFASTSILLLISLLSFDTRAQSKGLCSKENNVLDYYLTIPYEIHPIFDDVLGPIKGKDDLRKNIELLDIKNGYLELQTKTIIPKISVALFRQKDRSPIIVSTHDGVSVQNVFVFRCVGSIWVESSKKLFPEINLDTVEKYYNKNNVTVKGKALNKKELGMVAHTLIRFKLPREGRQISAYASHPDLLSEKQVSLFSLMFSDNKFVFR